MLKAGNVPDFKSGEAAGRRAPLRAFTAVGAMVAGVETQAADGHENVVVAHKQGEESAGARSAVFVELLGGERALDQTGPKENVRDRSGAIVALVIEELVATTPDVRFALEGVGGADGDANGGGQAGRSGSAASVIVEEGGLNGRRRVEHHLALRGGLWSDCSGHKNHHQRGEHFQGAAGEFHSVS